MGILDRVKEQAVTATAAAKDAAKDAAQKGQAKLDEMQAKKVADGLLRDLGAAVYSQHAGHGTPRPHEEVDRLITALQEHESANGPIDLDRRGSGL